MTHPLAALIGLDIEDVARAVYDAMRFERRDKTPEWVKGGNSNAQVEARATAASILAALEAAPVPDLVEAAKVIERLQRADEYEPVGHDAWEAANTIRALIALAQAQAAQIAGLEKERDQWMAAAKNHAEWQNQREAEAATLRDEVERLRGEKMRLSARLWSIGHAAGIETKGDLMEAARAALEGKA